MLAPISPYARAPCPALRQHCPGAPYLPMRPDSLILPTAHCPLPTLSPHVPGPTNDQAPRCPGYDLQAVVSCPIWLAA
ncbi:MAG: hypothetical protein K6U11_04730 [bacterium]|nr:hypothetical protein [bacterium]